MLEGMSQADHFDDDRRRPGRPRKHDPQALVAAGLEYYLERPHKVSTATLLGVARHLAAHTSSKQLSESTLRSMFSPAGPANRPRSAGALARFFWAVAELAEQRRAEASDEEERAAYRKLSKAIADHFPPGDDELQRLIGEVRSAPTAETAWSATRHALAHLKGAQPGREQVRGCATLLASYRAFLPLDEHPGRGLSDELELIDLLTSAIATSALVYQLPGSGVAVTKGWLWGGLDRLPQIEPLDVQRTARLLRAEAHGRHGVPPETASPPAQPAESEDGEPDDAEDVTLGRARGLVERGDLEAAATLVEAADGPLLLWTAARLYHAATDADHEPAREVAVAACRRRIAVLEASAEQAGDAYEGAEDFALDEALAMVEPPGDRRIEHLAALASRQLTDRYWRRTATGWSTAESVQVLAAELDAVGRHADASTVVCDLFQVTGWPPDPTGLDGQDLRRTERATLERLAARHPDAIPSDEAIAETWKSRLGVDTEVASTRRTPHGGPLLPQVAVGGLVQQIFVQDPDLFGERRDRRRSSDALRRLGWLLELRAARQRHPRPVPPTAKEQT